MLDEGSNIHTYIHMHVHPYENTNIHTYIDLLVDMFLHEYSFTLISITSSVFIYCLSLQLRLFFFSLMFVPFFFLCFFRFPSFFSCFRDRLSRSFYTLFIIVYILPNQNEHPFSSNNSVSQAKIDFLCDSKPIFSPYNSQPSLQRQPVQNVPKKNCNKNEILLNWKECRQ